MWPHFQSLFFLKDQVAGRASSGNMSQCLQSQSLVEWETDPIGTEAALLSHEEDRDGNQSTSSTPSPSLIPRQSSMVKRKRSSTDSLHQQMLEIEREKLKALMKPDDEEDEVKLFCLSIVPKIKKLSPDRQSLFCVKRQECSITSCTHQYNQDSHPFLLLLLIPPRPIVVFLMKQYSTIE